VWSCEASAPMVSKHSHRALLRMAWNAFHRVISALLERWVHGNLCISRSWLGEGAQRGTFSRKRNGVLWNRNEARLKGQEI